MSDTPTPPAAPIGPTQSSTWGGLSTESRHPDSTALDTLATAEIVTLLLEEDRRGIAAALHLRDSIATVAERMAQVYANGGSILFLGAGTSGRLGILEAAECPPTFDTDPERIRGAIAGGLDALVRSQEGAEDREEDGARAVADLERGDLLLAISASSVTPYVRGALAAARGRGAHTVLLTCSRPSSALSAAADQVLALDTGPEILTGSTRLKAGSATKAVLNAISTAAMVSLGKVFENLMVDLRPASAKLRDRATRIVATATGLPAADAAKLLERADGQVKTAIVMQRRGLGPEEARRRLDANDDSVRAALAASGES